MADITIPKGDCFTVGQATTLAGPVTPFAAFGAYGDRSAPNWYARGIGLDFPAATYTDTTSSGEAGSVYHANWGTWTVEAEHPTVYGRAATIVANPPKAGPNVTIGNPYCFLAKGDCQFEGQTYMGGAHVKGPTAAKGELYVNPCSGRPTDVPDHYSGVVAVRFDTVGLRWWVYDNGAWR